MKYMCQLCGFVYDDDKEAVPFADLPDDWTCPMCGGPKSLFIAVEEEGSSETSEANVQTADGAQSTTAPAAASAAAAASNSEPANAVKSIAFATDIEGDMVAGLSAGQLAALCGNLARGCEKQSRQRESELFRSLATYFTAHVAPVQDASIDRLSELLLEDTGRYAEAREAATKKSDRGALRIITWGERITNMLSYLVGRYLNEGEAFLADTEIWVCTVCGFVYVGDNPPELCPVCKVPSWKFQKMEGRA